MKKDFDSTGTPVLPRYFYRYWYRSGFKKKNTSIPGPRYILSTASKPEATVEFIN